VLIATERIPTRGIEDTRVIISYGNIEWIKDAPPTIGFGDGDCRGQVGFTPPPESPRDIANRTILFIVGDPLDGPRCAQKMKENVL
jgi:hypothetical protein